VCVDVVIYCYVLLCVVVMLLCCVVLLFLCVLLLLCVFMCPPKHEFFLVFGRVFMSVESVDSDNIVTYNISSVYMSLGHRLLCFVVIDPYG
jgi:hypothetical protein